MTNDELTLLGSGPAREFIAAYRYADLDALALSATPPPGVPVRACVEQIACRRKAEGKLGALAHRGMLFEPLALQQCSHEACARYKASFMGGARLVDTSSGLGIDAVFLAAVFREVVCFERNDVLVNLLKANLNTLGLPNVTVGPGDGMALLSEYPDNAFDWVYCDPCRRGERGRHIDLALCSPDVTVQETMMLRKAPSVCIKASPAYDVDKAASSFTRLREIHAVSVGGECKELLLVLRRENGSDNRRVAMRAVVIGATGGEPAILKGKYDPGNKRGNAEYVVDRIGQFLLEPDPAVVKSTLTDVLAAEHGCGRIAPNAQYLTSDSVPSGFPGRVFNVIEVLPWQRRKVGEYCSRRGIAGASVTRRDFPVSPQRLRAMLGLGESARDFLVCTRFRGNPVVIHAQRIGETPVETR